MAATLDLRFEEVRSLAFGSISGTYAQIGTALSRPIRMLMLQNLTDQVLMFSFDGEIDHIPLPAGGLLVMDVATNDVRESGFFISKGTEIYVKEEGASPTTGSVYLSTTYARGS